MEQSSPPPPPTTVRRNPHRRARNTPFVPSSLTHFDAAGVAATIQPFSLEEAPETVPLPPLPSPSPSPTPTPAKPSDSTSSNLKVFLRIRPAEIKPQPRARPGGNNPTARGRAKGSPQKAKKKKKTEVCLAVNGPESVTLTIPKSKLVDSKRGNKSEIYDGFSFVFPPESLQTDVYDKVMNPLVKDFMGGKSALLVAMGPTGSGKTHTMFGSNREPGLVPLALRKILRNGEKNVSQPRSFYLAMLEIYSVSGKGEKMIDLLSDGAELTLVQSTIKGLEEVPVSDLDGAERLVARGMSKRSTAATDANSQSSRSQCIITIRRANDIFNPENDMSFGNGVLVIADLAGAERDKKTGNIGTRIGESHFINNTSMVFGLCLRSLLEHQKNPKRPLEMHYKNSLLTKYLKEYLEGKKRMTLILTVKPGEDDYVDTSFVLRQAAPYMKIKYTNIDEVNAPPPVQKRNYIALAQQGYKKRRKVDGDICVDSTVAVEKSEEEKLEVVQATEDLIIQNTAPTVDTIANNAGLNAELQLAKRNEVIMTQFARAFWLNLKLYKDKLLKSENEVHSLRTIIIEKDRRIVELEGELAKVLSCQKQSEQVISYLDGNESGNTSSVSVVSMPGSISASSNSATASSLVLPENSLLSDCEQATVLSIKEEHEDEHSENLKNELAERVCNSFAAEPEHIPNWKATGDPLEMACLESNTEKGRVPSTENQTQSSLKLKEGASIITDTSPSLVLESRRRSIKFHIQHAASSGCGFAERPDGELIFRSEESTDVSDISASIAFGKIDLLSDFEQGTVLSDDKNADKKSEDLEEEETNETCDDATENNYGDIDPLQMICPDSDIDEEQMLGIENEPKPCTGIKFVSACYSEGEFAKESDAGYLSSEGSIEEPKNYILEQTVSETASLNCTSSLKLSQTIQQAEVVALMNCEVHDECKSPNIIGKEEETCSCINYLEHQELLPDQILREDDVLQKVCPDSDADEEEMLSGENKIQLHEHHSEAKTLDNPSFSPLEADDQRQSSEFIRQRKNSFGGYSSDGSEARKALNFEGSTDEASDDTLDQRASRKDAASSTTSFSSQDIFEDSQADKIVTQLDFMIRSPEQFNQDSSSSFKESKEVLEIKRNTSCEEHRKETRHDPLGGNSNLLLNMEPKKDPEELPCTSLGCDEKSSIERRKENQPIKSLIEVIGKENHASPSKPLIARKPKRRLRPASSMLLKEFTSPNMDPDIPKEGRGKTPAEETIRSEGSISLIQLLTGPTREKK